MASDSKAYTKMMFARSKSTMQLAAELSRIQGKHGAICREAARRLERQAERCRVVEVTDEQREAVFILLHGREPFPSETLVIEVCPNE